MVNLGIQVHFDSVEEVIQYAVIELKRDIKRMEKDSNDHGMRDDMAENLSVQYSYMSLSSNTCCKDSFVREVIEKNFIN